MQYEYIGQVPNNNNYVKGKRYFVNPKRDGDHVICNILEVSDKIKPNTTQQITTVVYHDIPAFRHEWKVVSSELIQDRAEALELTK